MLEISRNLSLSLKGKVTVIFYYVTFKDRAMYFCMYETIDICKKRLYLGLNEMSHNKNAALERLVIQLLGGLNRYYGILNLALGLYGLYTLLFR